MADQPRILDNTYFQKDNHIRLKKSEVTKSLILDAAVQRASGLSKTIVSPADRRGGGALPTLELTIDNLDQDPPAFTLVASDAGTVTWEFHSTSTAPAKGAGDIATGTFAVVSGSNSGSLDLEAYQNETGYLFFRLTVSGVDSLPTDASQEITVPIIRPTFVSGSPSDGGTIDFLAPTIVLTFSETVVAPAAGGEFYLYDTSGPTLIETFDVDAGTGNDGGTISVSGTDVTINPGSDLVDATSYSIRWNANAVEDVDGWGVDANTGDTLYDFSVAVAGFSPSSLFASSEAGAWYDPSDLSTLWQDASATVAVTADGDPVRRMDDKSGNGHHLVAASDTVRPLYKTSGGLHWLQYDGTDDKLSPSSTFSVISAGATAVAGVDYTGNFSIAQDTGSPGNVIFQKFSADYYVAGNTDRIYREASVTPPTIPHVLTVQAYGAVAPTLAINRTARTLSNLVARPYGANWSGVLATVSGVNSSSKVYGLVIRETSGLAAGQIADLEDWIAAKTGVSL